MFFRKPKRHYGSGDFSTPLVELFPKKGYNKPDYLEDGYGSVGYSTQLKLLFPNRKYNEPGYFTLEDPEQAPSLKLGYQSSELPESESKQKTQPIEEEFNPESKYHMPASRRLAGYYKLSFEDAGYFLFNLVVLLGPPMGKTAAKVAHNVIDRWSGNNEATATEALLTKIGKDCDHPDFHELTQILKSVHAGNHTYHDEQRFMQLVNDIMKDKTKFTEATRSMKQDMLFLIQQASIRFMESNQCQLKEYENTIVNDLASKITRARSFGK